MLASLALIFLVGFSLAALCRLVKLPRIIGMLVTGVLLGPYVLDMLDPSILGISSELREMALIIILIKAGLSLDISDLKKIGRPAVLMSFLPAVFEILAFVLAAPYFLHINRIEAALTGAVLGAVSPAIVVPKMVNLMEKNYGTDKKIPQLILAGSSMDDVFVIVLFGSFISMAQGENTNFAKLIDIPVSIVLGVSLGALAGLLTAWVFERFHSRGAYVRNSTKVILVLGVAFLLVAISDWVEKYVAVSGLLAVISMAVAFAAKAIPSVKMRLSEKFGKLWIAAEVILFVLVGAAVNIDYMMEAGFSAILMIFIGLLFRSAGVLLCLVKTNLTRKEKLYCIIAYIPKATVQAAIGSVPLSLGLPCGNIVLSVAVLSILITAPLGAVLMDRTYKSLLKKSVIPSENILKTEKDAETEEIPESVESTENAENNGNTGC